MNSINYKSENTPATTITYNGETHTISKWAKELDIPNGTLRKRLENLILTGDEEKDDGLITNLLRPCFSKIKTITHDGQTLTISKWAEKLDIPVAALRARVRTGDSPAMILRPAGMSKKDFKLVQKAYNSKHARLSREEVRTRREMFDAREAAYPATVAEENRIRLENWDKKHWEIDAAGQHDYLVKITKANPADPELVKVYAEAYEANRVAVNILFDWPMDRDVPHDQLEQLYPTKPTATVEDCF